MGLINDELKSKTIEQIKQTFFFLRMVKVNMWLMVLSVILSVFFAQMAAYVIYLLFPLANGIIQNDFSAVKNLSGLNFVITSFPEIFNDSTRLFILLVVWIYGVTILKNVFSYFSVFCVQTQAKLATVRLRQSLIQKCLSFGKAFYDKYTIAYLQSILTTSTDLIETRCKIFQKFVAESLLMASYLLIMFMVSWKLTMAIALIFPILSIITRKIVNKIRRVASERDKMILKVNDRIFNMLYCMPIIKSFSKEKSELESFSKASDEEIERSFYVQKIFGLVNPVEDVATMTINLCIALAMAMVIKFDRSLTAADAFVYFYLAMKTVPGLNAFNRFKLGLAGMTSSLDDIEKILTQEDSLVVPSGSEVFSKLKEGVEFRNLSFAYPNQALNTLDSVSFFIKKKSIVAIVGPSGSGKSTLVNLFLRFYDCPSGSIFVDGRDIREYDISSLRKRVAFVGQDVLLFNDTIRNNILYGASAHINDRFLKEVMQTISIHDFIENMPNQYETLVGERGARLSGGERQRLGIARAMMRDADILIMDEATSSLDSITEASITEGILSLAKEKTIIIIAHRLSTIRNADKVIYFEGGRVAEIGALPELIDKKGLFYRQWELQNL